jgi:hypothetical protein
MNVTTNLPAAIEEHDPRTPCHGRRWFRVGGWELEWQPSRPFTLWAIPEHLKTWVRTSGGVYYGEDRTQKMGWDYPAPPAYVRNAALTVMREIHQNGGE